MRFLGHTEAAEFIAKHPLHGETLCVWIAEIRNRDWHSHEALAHDFRSISIKSPYVSFRVGNPELLIETMLDFRNQIVLLTGIHTLMDSPVSPIDKATYQR